MIIMNSPLLRVVGFVLVFILVVVLPWWLSAIILITLTAYLPFYLEVVFFGFLIDALYTIQYSFPYIGLVTATVFLLITMFVKTRIRKF